MTLSHLFGFGLVGLVFMGSIAPAQEEIPRRKVMVG